MKILLVIPAYRERDRLPRFLPRLCEAVKRSGMDVEILTVDDGSGSEQASWLQVFAHDLRRQFPELREALLLPQNGGKGHAVYEGWCAAPPEGETPPDWLGFVDADGAVTAEEVVRLLGHLPQQDPAVVGLYAVRTGQGNTLVRREWRRKISGWGFRKLVKLLYRFPVPDTQCGCKFVRAVAFQEILPKLTERRFCFDVELTSRLLEKGRITCVPISWTESPGSRLGFTAVLHMAASVLRLKDSLKK